MALLQGEVCIAPGRRECCQRGPRQQEQVVSHTSCLILSRTSLRASGRSGGARRSNAQRAARQVATGVPSTSSSRTGGRLRAATSSSACETPGTALRRRQKRRWWQFEPRDRGTVMPAPPNMHAPRSAAASAKAQAGHAAASARRSYAR
ncbi:unnamed protein product, partial [Ectocarpus sp. 12 AP-2014]